MARNDGYRTDYEKSQDPTMREMLYSLGFLAFFVGALFLDCIGVVGS